MVGLGPAPILLYIIKISSDILALDFGIMI